MAEIPRAEYYIYGITNDGWEDIIWYTEDMVDTPLREREAIKQFKRLEFTGSRQYRLYRITRPNNKKELLMETAPKGQAMTEPSLKDNQPSTFEQILDDAYRMGVNAGKGLWDDYPTLKKGMLAKLESVMLQLKNKTVNPYPDHEDGILDWKPINHAWKVGYKDAIYDVLKVIKREDK